MDFLGQSEAYRLLNRILDLLSQKWRKSLGLRQNQSANRFAQPPLKRDVHALENPLHQLMLKCFCVEGIASRNWGLRVN